MNLRTETIYYCGNSCLAIAASALDIDFLGDVIGTEWGLKFEKSKMQHLGIGYEKYRPTYYLTSEITPVKSLLKELYSVEVKKMSCDSKNDYLNKAIKTLNQGIPFISTTDGKYLSYFEEFNCKHPETPHCIAVYEITNDKISFLDTIRGFVEGTKHEVTIESFFDLIYPVQNPLDLKLEFYYLQRNANQHQCGSNFINKFEDSIKSMKYSKSYEENGLYHSFGLTALFDLKNEFNKFLIWNNDKLINEFIQNFFEMIVLIVQQRKSNILFMEKYGKYNNDLVNLAKNICKQWNLLEITLINMRKKNIVEIVSKSILIIENLYKLESEFVDYFA